jgi:glycosyltransferase involved in cell wall biosynthesis
MRILLITERPYFPQQVGGREWVIHETAYALKEMGHEPFVMCALKPSTWIHFRNRAISRVKGISYPVDYDMGYPVFRGWLWERGLQEIIRKVNPDVAIIEASNALTYAKNLLLSGIPSIIRMHNTASHMLGGNPQDFHHVPFVAVSQFLADRFYSKYATKAIVIPPLVRREQCITASSREKIVFVNPRPVKGGNIAIAIAAKCPSIPFKFFEAWTKDENVKDLERQAQALPNVEWSPPVMDPKILYKEAHTMLIPSQADETWGRVATEAQFNGIPVIASRRGALPESVGPGGILIEPNADLDAWVSALRLLWDNPGRYSDLSQAALTFSERPEIASSHIMEHILELIDRAIAQFPG